MFALTLALSIVPAAVSSGDHEGPIVPGPASFPQTMERIVMARVHHTRLSVVRNTNARRIGRSLSTLHPTWVSGMIRYARGQHPIRHEVRAWREISRIVRKKLNNDGWFFDFYSNAYEKRPRMIRAAIASAHAHGEWIGGNIFGIKKKRPLPMRSDFLAIQDFRGHLDLHAVARLPDRVPLVYHLENDPDRPMSAGCNFIKNMTTAKRSALVRRRAHQQARYGFRFQYPVLYPECLRYRGRRTFLQSYNAFRDPPMARTILRMLNRYD